ncbi:MAG TPA: hypothetical protein VN310_01375 [Candidatus Dormibacteraeota bacterium]|jgi:hypothetical protein|nr:hypothetical protein [Candidatus Dormibacteraeota bacterium]
MSGRPTRFGEITVDSDFTTTALLVVLFIILSLMLTRDIRHILWGTPNQIVISGTLNRLGAALTLVYCLFFVFRWPNRLVKIGCALFAAHLSLALALTYLRSSLTARPTLAFADSMVMQISLLAFLVAIADWFWTVAHWVPPSRGGHEDQ